MFASKNGHTDIVKCLVDAKAQLDLQQKASIDHIFFITEILFVFVFVFVCFCFCLFVCLFVCHHLRMDTQILSSV